MQLKLLQSKKGLLIVGLIFFLSLSMVYVVNHRLLRNVKHKVVTKIEEQLKTTVEIKAIKLGGLNQVVIEEFQLAGSTEPSLVATEKVIIHYKWLDLLFNSLHPVRSIQKIRLIKPEVNLIKQDEWNYEFLRQQWQQSKEDSGGLFSFAMIIKQGQINYKTPQLNKEITDISGEAKLGQVISADLTGRLSALSEAEFKVEGQLANQEYRGEINFSRLDIARFEEEFGLEFKRELPVDYQGLLTGKLKASGKLGELPNYYGDLKLKQGQLTYQGLQLQELTAEIGINNYGLKIKKLSANCRQSLLTIQGEVFNWEQPQLNLAYNIQEFKLAKFSEYLPSDVQLAGQVEAAGEIRGAVKEPNITGDIKLAAGQVNQETISDFSARIYYKEEIVNIKQLAFNYKGGQISGDGTVNLKDKLEYMLSLNFSRLQLGQLSLATNYNLELGGLASGEGIISGQGLNKEKLNVLGSISVEQGSMVGYPFDQFTSNFWVNKGKVFLNQTELAAGQSNWELEGIMNLNGKLNLTLQASKVKLSDLQSLHRLDKLAGRINLKGELNGSLAQPQFEGQFAVDSLNYSQFSLNQAQGVINYKNGIVNLQQASLPDLNTQVVGEINFKRKTSQIMMNTTEPVAVEKMLARADVDFPAVGMLAGSLEIKNVLKSPQVTGDLVVKAGQVFEQPVDQLQLDFNYQNKRLAINNLQARYQASTLQATGELKEDQLDLDVSGQGVRLQDIKRLAQLEEVKGKTNLQGRVYGKLTDLKLAGQINTENLQLKQYQLGTVTAAVHYEQPNLYIRNGKLTSQDNQYQFQGGIDLDQHKFNRFTIDILQGDLAYLDQFLQQDLRLTHQLQGRVIVNGLLGQPKVNLDLVVNDIDQTGKLQIQGDYWVQKGIDVNLMARQFTVAPLINLKSLFDFKLPVSNLDGEANLTGRLTGNLDSLHLDSELKIVDGELGNLDYQQLSGRIKLIKGQKLFIQQSLQREGTEILRANGIIPLNQQEKFDLDIKVKEGNLSLLSLAIKDLESVYGRGEANLSLQGTWQNINIQGQAEVVAGSFTHPVFDRKVKQLSGRLKFKGNEVIVDRLTGEYGQGNVQATGSILLNGFLPKEYNLQVIGKKIAFNHGSWQGMNDADLEIKGSFYNPLIKGKITAYDTMFKLPVKWPTPDQQPKIVPYFDLDIKPGQNVKVGNENIDILVQQGLLELNTTEQGDLELTGNLASSSGHFTYYNTEFELIQAAANFSKYGFIPRLDIRARTTLAGKDGEFKEIYFDLQGLGEDLDRQPWNISFSSNPPMSRKEIISLLTNQGGIGNLLEKDYEQAVKNEVRRIIGQGIKTELLYKIERSFEKSLNLDQVRIKSLLTEELEIKIGKYIFDDFMLKFTKTFGIEEKYSYGFEYRFDRGIDNLQLNGNYDNQGHYKLGMELNIPF